MKYIKNMPVDAFQWFPNNEYHIEDKKLTTNYANLGEHGKGYFTLIEYCHLCLQAGDWIVGPIAENSANNRYMRISNEDFEKKYLLYKKFLDIQ